MAVRYRSTACNDGKIRANECRGIYICTMLSVAEFRYNHFSSPKEYQRQLLSHKSTSVDSTIPAAIGHA